MAYSMERLRKIADYARTHSKTQTVKDMKTRHEIVLKAMSLFGVEPLYTANSAALTKEDMGMAQELRDYGMTATEIAEKFDVSPATVLKYTAPPNRIAATTLRDRLMRGDTPEGEIDITVNGVIVGKFVPIDDTIKPH